VPPTNPVTPQPKLPKNIQRRYTKAKEASPTPINGYNKKYHIDDNDLVYDKKIRVPGMKLYKYNSSHPEPCLKKPETVTGRRDTPRFNFEFPGIGDYSPSNHLRTELPYTKSKSRAQIYQALTSGGRMPCAEKKRNNTVNFDKLLCYNFALEDFGGEEEMRRSLRKQSQEREGQALKNLERFIDRCVKEKKVERSDTLLANTAKFI
jgi:hypothetical protein